MPEPGPTRREWIISIFMFCLTFLTATLAGLSYVTGSFSFLDILRLLASRPQIILRGIQFSFPLIAILTAHEFGHFFACRHYGMRCTPPFFIPMPFPPTGTLGAFIKIKSPFRSKKALFDIGIAGPLAGFAFTLPVLWIGISLSRLAHKLPATGTSLSFGEPLIFRLIAMATLNYAPARQDLMAHPMAMAGWVGLLATSLNLLPVWQLDGGHITYALTNRERQKNISIVAIIALILASFQGWPTPSYLMFGLMLLIIGWRVRFYHPMTMRDEQPLETGRILLGGVALLILILSFTPVPISVR